MKTGRFVIGAAVLAVSGGLVWSQTTSVEEPPYRIVQASGPFELRDYPALVVAETAVTGDQKAAAAAGFRILAAYIFGANKGGAKIAMTAPVAETPAGEKIAMTAPVSQTPGAEGWVVRFTMPRGYALDSLPRPDDDRVRLREAPAVRVAALRFSGLAQPDEVAAKTALLSAWIKRSGLRAAGAATLAQYNPPWTLWFLRRNEVMIPVEA